MAVIVEIISRYANWIYAACAIIALWLLRTAFLARRDRRRSAFNLEREVAINRTHSTFRWALVLLGIIGAVYLVSTYLSEAVQPIIAQADPTPTPVFLIDTPTPTALPATETPTVTPTATPRPRSTPRPIPTEAPTETPMPEVVAPSCPDGRARIIAPGMGQEVSGPVQVLGTANTDSFQYYKIEFKPVGAPGDYSFYLSRESPVINGPLGVWDPGGLPPGSYALRLVTVDATGNFGECTVQVNVVR